MRLLIIAHLFKRADLRCQLRSHLFQAQDVLGLLLAYFFEALVSLISSGKLLFEHQNVRLKSLTHATFPLDLNLYHAQTLQVNGLLLQVTGELFILHENHLIYQAVLTYVCDRACSAFPLQGLTSILLLNYF